MSEDGGEIADYESTQKPAQDREDSTVNLFLRTYELARAAVEKNHVYLSQGNAHIHSPSPSPDSDERHHRTMRHRHSPSPARSPGVPTRRRRSSEMRLQVDDSDDSETMEYSTFLDTGRLSTSPRADRLSLGSSSPKSDIAGYWKTCVNEVPEVILCSWCKNVCSQDDEGGRSRNNLCVDSRHFCSEVCFSQSRRASFKKAKMCDWCQQFCGDKCLNQYKMHIFCRETEAHLQLHPHISELRSRESQALITPDLWLKDTSNTPSQKWNQLTPHLSAPEKASHRPFAPKRPRNDRIDVTSSSSTSPTHYDTNEPIDLCTQPSNTRGQDARVSTSTCTKDKTVHSPPKKSPPQRATRPKSRSKNDAKEMTKTASVSPVHQKAHTNDESAKATIRVRRLEEHPTTENQELMTVRSSPPGQFPHLSQFSNLLLGSRAPFMTGLPPIIPGAPGSEMGHPPILQQLLLSNQDLFRIPGFRPPLLFPQPQQMPIQPPNPLLPPAPPPPPGATAHSQIPKIASCLPPVTVMIPFPVPIPIPIPIPIPLPIFNLSKMNDKPYSETAFKNDDATALPTPPAPTKLAADVVLTKAPPASTSKNIAATGEKPPKVLISPELLKKESIFPPTPDKKKGRRSILKYTSDVYEINDNFLLNDDQLRIRANSDGTVGQESVPAVPADEKGPSSSQRKRKFPITATDNGAKKKHIAA